MGDVDDAVLGVFLREGAEKLADLNALLLRLEAQPRDHVVISDLVRTAHNLKGGAGTAGLGPIADAAHRIEEVVLRLRDGTMAADSTVFDALFASVDALEASLSDLTRGAAELPQVQRVVQAMDRLLGDDRKAAIASDARGPAGFVLGEYDHVRIKVLRQRGKCLLRVELSPPATEADPVPWARELLRRLRRQAEIVATLPAEVDLEPLGATRRLAVLCGTDSGSAVLEAALIAAGAEQVAIAAVDTQGGTDDTDRAPRPRAKGSVKIELSRVDGLLDMIGELVIAQSMAANVPEIACLSSRRARQCLGQVTRITRDLQDAGLRLRMVPVRGLFQAMARTVRDLARKHGKEIRLITSGDDVELDRSVVERITDPMVHLVRNAVDHGIETPSERAAGGKGQAATITLAAYHQGGSIIVEVKDDGRGLDRDAIRAKAGALGLIRDGATIRDADLLNLIFESGLSTSAEVTDTSGRGVGLDIVRRNVEAMRGRVSVASVATRGTSIKMVLPLTLAIIDGMLVGCGAERYIIPTMAVVESIRPLPEAVVSVAGRREMLNVRGSLLPLVSLSQLFQVEGGTLDASRGLVVVVEGIGRSVGLIVDSVLAQQQVVIKSIGSGLGRAKYLSGAAILPDGKVGLIVNVDEITVASAQDAAALPDAAQSPDATPAAGAVSNPEPREVTNEQR